MQKAEREEADTGRSPTWFWTMKAGGLQYLSGQSQGNVSGGAESQRCYGAGQLLDGGLVQVLDARLLDVGLRAGQGGHAVPPDQGARTPLHFLWGDKDEPSE